MTDPASSVSHPEIVAGLFNGRDSAECAYQSAIELGYEQADINLAMSDATRQRLFSNNPQPDTQLSDKAEKAPEGSSQLAHELGGPTGGTIGTIAPVLAAVGTLALIPGIAFVGPIAVALTAAGAVGLAGGLVGALMDWGIPENRVHQYETAIRSGSVLIGLKPRSDADASELKRRWTACGGELVEV